MENEVLDPETESTPQTPPAKKPKIKEDQATRILAKFGGARRLASALKALGIPRDPATIYKWTYPREKGGTGGLIPTAAWPDVLKAARMEGILISPEDMDPR